MKKRIVAVLLCLMMTMSCFVGCGSAEGEKETVQETDSQAAVKEESASAAVEEQKKEEPAKLTIATTHVLQMDPVPWYETEFYKWVWEQANVEVEVLELDVEQFNIMLSGGELPDIISGDSRVADKLDNIVSSKLALDMGPLLEEYAPNMALDIYAQRNELVKTYKGGEEQALYFVAPEIGLENARGNTESGRGYIVRWDWYKEIGAPEIASDDDYVSIIEQMVAAHPTTEKGEKVYGIGLYDEFSAWYMRGTFVQPAMTNPWTFNGHQYLAKLAGGELINGYTDMEQGAYWVDMRFYNKLYNKGLLDPDSFTQTSDAYSTKLAAGRYAADTFRQHTLYNEMVKEDPNTIVGHIRIPSSNALTFGNKKIPLGDFPSEFIFISAKSENWEAALRVLDVFHDPDTTRISWCGFEGEHWNYVNGVPTLTEETKKMISESSEELKYLGIRGASLFNTLQRSFMHSDGYPLDLNDTDEMRAETLTPFWKDYSDFYGVSYPSQAATKLVEEGKTIDMSEDRAQFINSVVPSMPTDVARVLEKCDDILYRAIPNLVMAATEAEFNAVAEQVQKDLIGVGEASAWEWCSKEYYEAKAVVDPIFDSIEW